MSDSKASLGDILSEAFKRNDQMNVDKVVNFIRAARATGRAGPPARAGLSCRWPRPAPGAGRPGRVFAWRASGRGIRFQPGLSMSRCSECAA